MEANEAIAFAQARPAALQHAIGLNSPRAPLYGEQATTTPSPSRPAIEIGEPVAARILTFDISGNPGVNRAIAVDDPDTGVVSVALACQTHSVQTWRRIGPRLIREHYPWDVERMTAALAELLDKIEAAYR